MAATTTTTAAAGATPGVQWAQRPKLIFLTMDVSDCKDHDIRLEKDSLHFKGRGGPDAKDFEINMKFLKEIDPDKSKFVVRPRGIEFALGKTRMFLIFFLLFFKGFYHLCLESAPCCTVYLHFAAGGGLQCRCGCRRTCHCSHLMPSIFTSNLFQKKSRGLPSKIPIADTLNRSRRSHLKNELTTGASDTDFAGYPAFRISGYFLNL